MSSAKRRPFCLGLNVLRIAGSSYNNTSSSYRVCWRIVDGQLVYRMCRLETDFSIWKVHLGVSGPETHVCSQHPSLCRPQDHRLCHGLLAQHLRQANCLPLGPCKGLSVVVWKTVRFELPPVANNACHLFSIQWCFYLSSKPMNHTSSNTSLASYLTMIRPCNSLTGSRDPNGCRSLGPAGPLPK